MHISAPMFDTSRRLKPWLFTIAANKARDAMRSRGRRRTVSLDATVDSSADAASFAELMPAEISAPDENILNLETRQAVINIVGEMPEPLRVVLLLCYFQGMSYKEIAAVIQRSEGYVGTLIHSASKKLSQRLRQAGVVS